MIGHKVLSIEEANELLHVVDVWGDKNFIPDNDCYGNPCPASTLSEMRYVNLSVAFQVIDEAVNPGKGVTFPNYLVMTKTQLREALKSYIGRMSK